MQPLCGTLGATQPPEVTVVPDYTTVRVGDTVELRCTTAGSSDSRVEWVRGPAGDLPIDAVLDNGMLRFRATGKDQEGLYECQATNSAGSTSATSYVIIEEGILYQFLSVSIDFYFTYPILAELMQYFTYQLIAWLRHLV